MHWAVYVIWPVAVIHALGSGSDVRSRILPVVAAVCTSLVLFASGWRVVTANIPAWQRGAWAAVGVGVMLVRDRLDAQRAASAGMGEVCERSHWRRLS